MVPIFIMRISEVRKDCHLHIVPQWLRRLTILKMPIPGRVNVTVRIGTFRFCWYPPAWVSQPHRSKDLDVHCAWKWQYSRWHWSGIFSNRFEPVLSCTEYFTTIYYWSLNYSTSTTKIMLMAMACMAKKVCLMSTIKSNYLNEMWGWSSNEPHFKKYLVFHHVTQKWLGRFDEEFGDPTRPLSAFSLFPK